MDCRELNDEALAERLSALVRREREDLSEVLVHLAEFDERRLAQKKAFPTLFAYCTQELGYSEAAAWKRIYTARFGRRFPHILRMISSGELHMAAVGILGPYLTEANHQEILRRARGRPKRELAFLAAELFRKTEPREVIRTLPTSVAGRAGQGSGLQAPVVQGLPGTDALLGAHVLTSGGSASPQGESIPSQGHGMPLTPPSSTLSNAPISAPPPNVIPPPERIEPLSPERVRFAFTGTRELLGKIDRARELLGRKHQNGGLEQLVGEAFEALLEKYSPDYQIPARPRPSSPEARRIPRWIRQEVWKRCGGQCAYVAPDGSRCRERRFLEFDHIKPWSLGGPSNDPENIRLLCGAHNRHMAREVFGDSWRKEEKMAGADQRHAEAVVSGHPPAY